MIRQVASRAARFARFLLAGAANTAVTYAVYLALLLLFPYAVSYAIAYVCGIAISYALNRRFVFRVEGTRRTMLLFPGVYATQYVLSAALLWLFIDKGGIDQRLAPLAVIALVVPATYLLTSLVFRHSAPTKSR